MDQLQEFPYLSRKGTSGNVLTDAPDMPSHKRRTKIVLRTIISESPRCDKGIGVKGTPDRPAPENRLVRVEMLPESPAPVPAENRHLTVSERKVRKPIRPAAALLHWSCGRGKIPE